MEILKTEIKNLQSEVFFKLEGALKGIEALNLKADLKVYAAKNKTLCIDLTEVNEISLTGLNAILMSKVYARKQNNEVNLILAKDSKLLHQLRLTKMEDQFTLTFASQYVMAA